MYFGSMIVTDKVIFPETVNLIALFNKLKIIYLTLGKSVMKIVGMSRSIL